MELPLHLQYSGSPRYETAGILIRGDAVATWISAATACDLPPSQLRFLPIHESGATDTTTIGALCIVPGKPFPQSVRGPERHLNYGCRAGRLYLPVEAQLVPVVSDKELDELLPGDDSQVFVWHPNSGLIGFETDHILTAAQLLSGPPLSEDVWDRAEVAEQLNNQIRTLVPEPSQDIGQILDDGQDDIGTESDNIDDAPRAPDEKSAALLRDGVNTIRRGIGKVIHNVTSRLPNAEDGSRLLGRLHDWAESLMGAGSAATSGSGKGNPPATSRRDSGLSTRRENEIKRLLNLLKHDPDNGLKYALPLGGDDRRRGVAPPSDRLGERHLDFDPNRMHGSGRGDAWDVPWEYQVRLQQQYRELAQREQRLGRYRRAAYIYAQLLNDLNAAAAALQAGQFYHDAATIYLKELQDPASAAKSLRNGGFWEEAVQIYRNRERWIDAGELYLEIDQPEDAKEMFQNEVKACEHRRDYVAAGNVADQRLDNAELATQLLFTGWMQAAHGRQCFQQLMNMYGRRGTHTDAVAILHQLTAEDELGRSQIEDAVTVCAQNATAYPDGTVREAARRHVWRLAAALLQGEGESADLQPKSNTALAAMRSIVPADRLLQADTRRYEMQLNLRRERKPPEVRPRRIKGPSQPAKLIGRVNLLPQGTPDGTRWNQIVSNGAFLFRCGETRDGRTVVVRQMMGTRRDGRVVTEDRVIVLPGIHSFEPSVFELRLNNKDPERVWLFPFAAECPWCSHDQNRQLLRDSGFVDISLVHMDSVWDICSTSSGWIFCLGATPGESQWEVDLHVVNAYMLADRRIRLQSLWEIVEPGAETSNPRLHTDGHIFYVLFGRTLLRTNDNFSDFTEHSSASQTDTDVIETFSIEPLRMVASPVTTMTRLVFSFAEGARAVWPVTGASCSLAQEMSNPITAFTNNGVLAAACRQTDRIDFYRLSSGEAAVIASCPCDSPVRHLTCGPASNQILAFHDGGRVTQLAVPKS